MVTRSVYSLSPASGRLSSGQQHFFQHGLSVSAEAHDQHVRLGYLLQQRIRVCRYAAGFLHRLCQAVLKQGFF